MALMGFVMPLINFRKLHSFLVPLWCCFALLAASSAFAGILNPQEQGVADKMAGSGQNRAFIQIDPILTKVARERAADMAKRHYFDHTNPDGHAANYLVRQAGYRLPDSYSTSPSANNLESIAAGELSASEDWGDWMGSAPHKRHLLAEDSFYVPQTSVGIGYYSDPNSDYGTYWVVISAPPQAIPTLTVTSPTAGEQVTVPQLAVSGTGAFITASGVANWSGVATGLVPGPNSVRIRSLNAAGGVIAEKVRAVSYIVYRPLTVNVAGSGSVPASFAGTPNRALGFAYTIAATPADGSLFAGWSGSSTAKSASLTFTMAESYTLTARFVPNPFLSLRGNYQGLLQGGAAGSITVGVTSMGAIVGQITITGTT